MSDLKKHVNVAHLKIYPGARKNSSVKYANPENIINCENCEAVYARKSDYDRHLAKFHPEKVRPMFYRK